VQPDRLDIDEWQGYKETARMVPELTDMMLAPDQMLPLEVARIMRPAQAQSLAGQMQQLIREAKEEANREGWNAGAKARTGYGPVNKRVF
jgi:hypothetical protein